MPVAILASLSRLAGEVAGGFCVRATATLVTLACTVVAVGFLTAAGFVVLAGMIGVPLAALAFSAVSGLAAVCANLIGRAATVRRAARVDAARTIILQRIAYGAGTSAGQWRSLMPLAAVLAACVLARRS